MDFSQLLIHCEVDYGGVVQGLGLTGVSEFVSGSMKTSSVWFEVAGHGLMDGLMICSLCQGV